MLSQALMLKLSKLLAILTVQLLGPGMSDAWLSPSSTPLGPIVLLSKLEQSWLILMLGCLPLSVSTAKKRWKCKKNHQMQGCRQEKSHHWGNVQESYSPEMILQSITAHFNHVFRLQKLDKPIARMRRIICYCMDHDISTCAQKRVELWHMCSREFLMVFGNVAKHGPECLAYMYLTNQN